MTTRIRYISTTPFSFRREQATTKFATTYHCPTPYAAKVALIVGAIRAGIDPNDFTMKIRNLNLRSHPWGEGVINTHLVKHWEPPRSETKKILPTDYFTPTVVFREFLYFTGGGVDLYVPSEEIEWLTPALPGVNCFGKQGSFFSLLTIEEAAPPVGGVSFTGSDMKSNATWDKVSNFTGNTNKPRADAEMKIFANILGGGQKYIHLKFDEL